MSWAGGTERDSETNDDHSIARSRVPQVVAEGGKDGSRQKRAALPLLPISKTISQSQGANEGVRREAEGEEEGAKAGRREGKRAFQLAPMTQHLHRKRASAQDSD